MKEQKIILTSYGLTTKKGRELIAKNLPDCLEDKCIYLFNEPYFSVQRILIDACLSLGFTRENIFLSDEQILSDELIAMDYIYIGEGNTYEMMQIIRDKRLDIIMRKAFENGATFIGTSAGSIICGQNIEMACLSDRNIVGMQDFKGLCLFDGIAIPHCTESELCSIKEDNPELEKQYSKIYSIANDGVLVID